MRTGLKKNLIRKKKNKKTITKPAVRAKKTKAVCGNWMGSKKENKE